MPVEDLAKYLADLKKLVAPIVGPELVAEAGASRTGPNPRPKRSNKAGKQSGAESDTSFDFGGESVEDLTVGCWVGTRRFRCPLRRLQYRGAHVV
jgi:hypothetical protein